MKKLNFLKTCLDLFYFFSIFVLVATTIFIPVAVLGDEAIDINVNGTPLVIDNWGARTVLILGFFAIVAFFYAIYLLRQNVHSFVKREIFTDRVIRNFNRIGIFLLASTLLTEFPLFFYKMIYRQHVDFGIETGSFDSGILPIALALFFMVLSEVFKIAKNLKEENDLTL